MLLFFLEMWPFVLAYLAYNVHYIGTDDKPDCNKLMEDKMEPGVLSWLFKIKS